MLIGGKHNLFMFLALRLQVFICNFKVRKNVWTGGGFTALNEYCVGLNSSRKKIEINLPFIARKNKVFSVFYMLKN